MDAPERIWAFQSDGGQRGWLHTKPPIAIIDLATEYVRTDLYEALRAELEAVKAENTKLYDDHETRVFMHHAVEEQLDTLLGAARDLIDTVDGAYPGNAWTAEIKRTIWDITDAENS